jgi:uncharacterized protein CbrC (UPF0167 family)
MSKTGFVYFEGPVSDMAGRVENAAVCTLCGRLGVCFDLGRTSSPALSDREKDAGHGCVDCLHQGKFEFWHDTEHGLLDQEGFRILYKDHLPAPSGFSKAVQQELRRTPRICTWQQERWLAHCEDFMVFIGTWEPEGFHRHARDHDGRALFMAMTAPDLQHLWDDSLPEKGGRVTSWHATYYAFRCRHCAVFRGNWDCD